jgi:hypothetical protein
MVRPVHRTNELTDKIEAKLPELMHLREDARNCNDEAATIQDELLPVYARLGVKTHTVKVTGGSITGTFTQSVRHELDEDKLKARVGATVFNKATVRKLDQKKLDGLIASGVISAADVAACLTDKPNNPSIKCTFNPARINQGVDTNG